MGAPLGFKTFTTGDVLTAADTNGYLMQGVWTFASAAARDAAVNSPQEGNMCYLKDTDAVQYYSGSAWTAVGGSASGFVGASVYNSTTQSINSATYTTATFDSEIYDTDAFHSTSSNTSRFTIPSGKAGKYQITAALTWGTTGTYVYGSVLRKNGADLQTLSWYNATTSGTYNTWSFIANLAVADYVEWQVYQSSGSAVNLKGNATPTERTTFTINYLGA